MNIMRYVQSTLIEKGITTQDYDYGAILLNDYRGGVPNLDLEKTLKGREGVELGYGYRIPLAFKSIDREIPVNFEEIDILDKICSGQPTYFISLIEESTREYFLRIGIEGGKIVSIDDTLIDDWKKMSMEKFDDIKEGQTNVTEIIDRMITAYLTR